MNNELRTIDKLEVGQELEVVLIDPDGREHVRDVLKIVRLPGHDDTARGEVRSIHDWQSQAPAGEGPWEIAKEAWKLFRECNTPAPPVTTWVLYKKTDPLEYADAKEGSSGPIRWVVRERSNKNLVWVDYELTVEGAYGARPRKGADIPQGDYLPKITAIVNQKAVAPLICVTGDVHLGAPYNVGGHDDVDPKLDIDLTLDLQIFWISHPYRCVFVAQGSKGFRFDGWR